ncbi:MAG TPA: HAD hydrolase-like protein [Candidatus Eisenbacteria bacterium]|nr:HAD hydrolase-like protein [Candidatus Eisenbacteria bacterium]
MTRPPLRHLFLDLDGTLVDPFEGITRSLAHALEVLGRPVPPRSELKTHIGPPLSNAFKSLLGTSEETTLRAAIHAYRERYSEVGVLENRVYDGIPETLRALRGDGIELHLVTSKPAVYARRVLEHSGLAGSFETVHGPDLDEIHLQKGALVQRALDAGAIAPSSAALAGDRGVDLDAARENEVFSIGVMWGYGTREELGAADSIVHSPSELLARIRALARVEGFDATG